MASIGLQMMLQPAGLDNLYRKQKLKKSTRFQISNQSGWCSVIWKGKMPAQVPVTLFFIYPIIQIIRTFLFFSLIKLFTLS